MDGHPIQELSFIVAGEAYRQVREWQAATDQAVIRAWLEWRRLAQVWLAAGGKPAGGKQAGPRRVETVRQLPEPGQAEPFYGPQGGGYRFTFSGCSEALACRLQVDNTAMERMAAKGPPVAGYTPLALETGGAGDMEASNAGDTPTEGAGDVLDLDDPQVRRRLKAALEGGRQTASEIRFVIDAELLKKLAAWPRWGRPLDAYAFIFRPLSTGTEVQVRLVETGETVKLSEG